MVVITSYDGIESILWCVNSDSLINTNYKRFYFILLFWISDLDGWMQQQQQQKQQQETLLNCGHLTSKLIFFGFVVHCIDFYSK
jgi:hypothetical protein